MYITDIAIDKSNIEINLNLKANSAQPYAFQDNDIIEIITKAIDTLPMDLPSGEKIKYLADGLDKLKIQLTDNNSVIYGKIKNIILELFNGKEGDQPNQKKFYNPFAIEKRLIEVIHNYAISILAYQKASVQDLASYALDGSSQYLQSKLPKFEELMRDEFQKDESVSLKSVIKDIFTTYYEQLVIDWDSANPGSAPELSDDLKKYIDNISNFTTAIGGDNVYANDIISSINTLLESIFSQTQAEFESDLNNVIQTSFNNKSSVYLLYTTMRNEFVVTAVSKLISLDIKIEKKKVQKFVDAVAKNDIADLDKILPGIKAIFDKYKITDIFYKGKPTITEINGSSILSSFTIEEQVSPPGSAVEFKLIVRIDSIQIDDTVPITEQASKEINAQIANYSNKVGNKLDEFDLHNILGFNSTEYALFSTENGYLSFLDSLNLFSTQNFVFNFDALNGDARYSTKVNMGSTAKYKIVNDKLYAYIYLEEKNQMGEIISTKEFEIDLNITVGRIFDTLYNMIDELNFQLIKPIYLDQLFDNSGNIISSINSYGQNLLISRYINYNDLMASVNVLISRINLYKNVFLTQRSVEIDRNGFIYLVTTLLGDGGNNEEFRKDLVDTSDLYYLSDKKLPDNVTARLASYKESTDLLYLITPRSTTDQPPPNIGGQLPQKYKLKVDYKYNDIVFILDSLRRIGYSEIIQSPYVKFASEYKGIARKGVRLTYGATIESLISSQNNSKLSFEYEIFLNFIKASKKDIDSALESIIDSIPSEARGIPDVIEQIKDKFNEGIYDNGKYKDDVGIDDLVRKIATLTKEAEDLDIYLGLREKISKIFDGKIPPETLALLENADNFGTLATIAELYGKVDVSLLREILTNSDLIKRLNELSSDSVDLFVRSLDTTKEVSKYAYFGIGAALGLVGSVAAGSSLYLARTNSKAVRIGSKIKSGKTIIIISTLLSLVSIAASAVMMLLFFIEKGGF